MTALELNATDKTGCPITTILFTGETSDQMEELSTSITDYSDGYKLEL
jgi:hypothetical protein